MRVGNFTPSLYGPGQTFSERERRPRQAPFVEQCEALPTTSSTYIFSTMTGQCGLGPDWRDPRDPPEPSDCETEPNRLRRLARREPLYYRDK